VLVAHPISKTAAKESTSQVFILEISTCESPRDRIAGNMTDKPIEVKEPGH